MKKTPALPHYGLIARVFHWGMALLIFGLVCVGAWMADMEPSATKFAIYGVHKSLGLLVIALLVARVAWMRFHPAPPLPKGTSKVAAWLAKGVHAALYALMLLVPLAGWLMSDAAGHPPDFFGLPVPVLMAPDPAWLGALHELHELAAWAMVALLVLHVAAAMAHHAVLHDDVLARMLPPASRWPTLPAARTKTLRKWMPALLLLAVLTPATAAARPWEINPTQSRIQWQAFYKGAPVEGHFSDWYGEVFFDPNILEGTDIDITVLASSIKTPDYGLDLMLQTPDWFDAKVSPKISFTSRHILAVGPNAYVANGVLRMGGVSRTISIPFSSKLSGDHARVTGSFRVNRRDFGIGKGFWLDTLDVADMVSVSFVLNAVRK